MESLSWRDRITKFTNEAPIELKEYIINLEREFDSSDDHVSELTNTLDRVREQCDKITDIF